MKHEQQQAHNYQIRIINIVPRVYKSFSVLDSFLSISHTLTLSRSLLSGLTFEPLWVCMYSHILTLSLSHTHCVSPRCNHTEPDRKCFYFWNAIKMNTQFLWNHLKSIEKQFLWFSNSPHCICTFFAIRRWFFVVVAAHQNCGTLRSILLSPINDFRWTFAVLFWSLPSMDLSNQPSIESNLFSHERFLDCASKKTRTKQKTVSNSQRQN